MNYAQISQNVHIQKVNTQYENMPSFCSTGIYGIESNHHPISYVLKLMEALVRSCWKMNTTHFKKAKEQIQKIQQFHHEGFVFSTRMNNIIKFSKGFVSTKLQISIRKNRSQDTYQERPNVSFKKRSKRSYSRKWDTRGVKFKSQKKQKQL